MNPPEADELIPLRNRLPKASDFKDSVPEMPARRASISRGEAHTKNFIEIFSMFKQGVRFAI